MTTIYRQAKLASRSSITVRSINNRRQHYQETSLLCKMVEMQVMSKNFEEMVSNFQFVIVKLAYNTSIRHKVLACLSKKADCVRSVNRSNQ